MSSRSLKDLHPKLVERWKSAVDGWNKLRTNEPSLPEVFITQTYRSPSEQNELYAQGRTKPGKIVTRARGLQSLHNYSPALAIDFAFRTGKKVFWDIPLFRRFAGIAKSFKLAWGGDWTGGFKDYAHLEPPKFSWEQAKKGETPQW